MTSTGSQFPQSRLSQYVNAERELKQEQKSSKVQLDTFLNIKSKALQIPIRKEDYENILIKPKYMSKDYNFYMGFHLLDPTDLNKDLDRFQKEMEENQVKSIELNHNDIKDDDSEVGNEK